MELKGNSIKNIMKGVGIALSVTIISLIIFSGVLAYTNVPESTIKPVTIVIKIISVLIGVTILFKNEKKNVLINGALVGVIYMLFMYTLSSIISCFYIL